MAGGSKREEVRRLLRVYRRGLIDEDTLAEQLEEIFGAGEKPLEYDGRSFPDERSMLLYLLDEYRAAEAFGAEAVGLWVEHCKLPGLRGGLRTICHREAAHAKLLAERLRELGGECRAEIPETVRSQACEALRSEAVSDLQKLQGAVAQLGGAGNKLAELRRVAENLIEDEETKSLLLTILDDEEATLRWLRETCAALGQEHAASEDSRPRMPA
ncbi:MAG: hypothetical protein KatS3mg076_1045 [Candidatus Binatia bacterium]|nr:MAG: hypothetical protein KatS3mg076_1045 [Candidatus Binatia bacterium]